MIAVQTSSTIGFILFEFLLEILLCKSMPSKCDSNTSYNSNMCCIDFFEQGWSIECVAIGGRACNGPIFPITTPCALVFHDNLNAL